MTNPYIRAAQRHAHIRQQALERLNHRPDHAGRPEWIVEDERPATPPGKPDTIDVAVIERARDERGRFVADDPTTPENEAWVEVPPVERGRGKMKPE
jgi:hypothetical protein